MKFNFYFLQLVIVFGYIMKLKIAFKKMYTYVGALEIIEVLIETYILFGPLEHCCSTLFGPIYMFVYLAVGNLEVSCHNFIYCVYFF